MSGNHDRYALQRFVDAQDRVYDTVLAELRAGRKRSHWMWFVFPQLRGLGRSATAQHFGIASLERSRAYLAHDVLGPRLRDAPGWSTAIDGRSVDEIFGWPDNLKLRSSMTLFAARRPTTTRDFRAVLDKFYGGEDDPATRRAAGPGSAAGSASRVVRRRRRSTTASAGAAGSRRRPGRCRSPSSASDIDNGASSMLSATTSASSPLRVS